MKKTYFFGDENKKFLFSKVLIFSSVFISLLCIICIVTLSIIFSSNNIFIDSTVLVTAIGLLGSICITALVFSLKKSQAENTTKIYMQMYKDIYMLKKNIDDSDLENFINEMEQQTINKMTDNLDAVLQDATSIIEKQDF